MSEPAKPTRNEQPAFFGVLVRGMQTAGHTCPTRGWRVGRLDSLLGLKELSSRVSLGAALTELNFTFLLEFFHVSLVRVAGDFGSSGILVVAIGKFIVILLCMFAGAASGAHMNPNISLATVMLGFTTVSRCMMYTVAQVTGAIAGITAGRAAQGWDHIGSAADIGGCNIGPSDSQGGALVSTAVFFHFILCIIGGVAFDDRQGEIFGPIIGPICIATAVGVSIFASAKSAMLINWAECLAIGIVEGEFNGSEWISFVGPTLASVVHAWLFLSVPPSHTSGKFTPPLFRQGGTRQAAQSAEAHGAPLMEDHQ